MEVRVIEIDAGLLAWIDGLRVRLRRGELAGLGPLVVGDDAALDAEHGVRIMLADLDHYGDLTPRRRAQPETRARYRALLRDFRDLRVCIG
jgi:hypothetical protein